MLHVGNLILNGYIRGGRTEDNNGAFMWIFWRLLHQPLQYSDGKTTLTREEAYLLNKNIHLWTITFTNNILHIEYTPNK